MSDHYFEHQELIKRTKLLVTKTFPKNLRLFDRHVGKFFIKRVVGAIINYIPIKINKKGMADVWGVFSLPLGGVFVPVHVELEFKTGKADLNPKQKEWRDFCVMMKWEWFLVRDENDFVNELNARLDNLQQDIIYGIRK